MANRQVKKGIVNHARTIMSDLDSSFFKDVALSKEQKVSAKKIFKVLDELFERGVYGDGVVNGSQVYSITEAFQVAFDKHKNGEKNASDIIMMFFNEQGRRQGLSEDQIKEIVDKFIAYVPTVKLSSGQNVSISEDQTRNGIVDDTENTSDGDGSGSGENTQEDGKSIGDMSDSELDALVEKAIGIIKDDSYVNTLEGQEKTIASDMFEWAKTDITELEKNPNSKLKGGIFGANPSEQYTPDEVRVREYVNAQDGENIRILLKECFIAHKNGLSNPNTALYMKYSHNGTSENPSLVEHHKKLIDGFMDFVLDRTKNNEHENDDEKNNDTGNGTGNDTVKGSDDGKGDGGSGKNKRKKRNSTKKDIKHLHIDKAIQQNLYLAEPKRGFWEKLLHRPAAVGVTIGVVSTLAIGAGLFLGPAGYYGLATLSKFALSFSGVLPGAIIGGAGYAVARWGLSKVSKSVKKSVLKNKVEKNLVSCRNKKAVSDKLSVMTEKVEEKANARIKDKRGLSRVFHKLSTKTNSFLLGKVFRPLQRRAKKSYEKKIYETIDAKTELNELETTTGKSMTFAKLQQRAKKIEDKQKKEKDKITNRKKAIQDELKKLEKESKSKKNSEADREKAKNRIVELLDEENQLDRRSDDGEYKLSETKEYLNRKYRTKNFNPVGEMSGVEYADMLEEEGINMTDYLDQKTYDREILDVVEQLPEEERSEIERLATYTDVQRKKYIEQSEEKKKAKGRVRTAEMIQRMIEKAEKKQGKGKKNQIVSIEEPTERER